MGAYTPRSLPPYLVLAGPTAAGKTAVALTLAERLDAEIVIADSRQIYRGLDIGTAKPTADERARVRHHLLDIRDVGARYSAADFAADAVAAIEEIGRRGRVAVVCGGTGFYLGALAGALDPIDDAFPAAARRTARERVASIAPSERYERLTALDPALARKLHANDRQRVDRGLEVYFLTGERLSALHSGGARPRPHLAFRLERTRDDLRGRIDRRLDEMLAAGLEREARTYWERGLAPRAPGLDTIGYQEWWPYFEGEIDHTEAVDRIRSATHRYAKRQETWFRNQGRYRPLAAGGADVVDRLLRLWEAGS